jgi:hypothetical protein
MVAFGLLGVALSVVTPLMISHNCLLTAHRQYQLALEEVTNHLERLRALPADELQPAVKKLAPSELAARYLHGAELKGELVAEDDGQRLTLRLAWKETQGKTAPVTLTAWIYPPQRPADKEGNP